MNPGNSSAVIQALADIVGPNACLTDPADTSAFTTDYRKLHRGDAIAVVLPASTDEVSRVMAWCHKNGVAVVPQGGNTSLMGGAVPQAGAGDCIVLNLRRMNRVLAVDPVDDTMTVQAGVTLNAARTAAEAQGRLFPLRIGSEGSCQIGGNLATNAGGTAVLRYGNMRDLVPRHRSRAADGRILGAARPAKDNTGYDLKQLFIGAEGTLGIITAAVLKLMPLPRAAAVAWLPSKARRPPVSLSRIAKQVAGPHVTAFELVSAPARGRWCWTISEAWPLRSPGRPDGWCWWSLTSGGDQEGLEARSRQILEAGMERGWVSDAAVAASVADAQRFWRIREEISDAQTRTGGSIKCDVSVPLSRVPGFIEEASRAVLEVAPRARMVVYGHMGDGNVHFNPLRPADQDARDFLAKHHDEVSHRVDGLAHSLGGSISAEHGIGVAKRDDLRTYKSAVEWS